MQKAFPTFLPPSYLCVATARQLYNNPLADPPAELLLLGMGAMLWECRRRHWVQVRGPPPVLRVHGFGIEVCRKEEQEGRNAFTELCQKIQPTRYSWSSGAAFLLVHSISEEALMHRRSFDWHGSMIRANFAYYEFLKSWLPVYQLSCGQ